MFVDTKRPTIASSASLVAAATIRFLNTIKLGVKVFVYVLNRPTILLRSSPARLVAAATARFFTIQ